MSLTFEKDIASYQSDDMESTVQNDEIHIGVPISKRDDESRMVWGLASTSALDGQGEIVTKEAVFDALPEYSKWRNIREMHGKNAVGTAPVLEKREQGLWIGAKIVDDAAWKKVQEGVYKAFSIGGKRILSERRFIKDLGLYVNAVTKMRLTEISIVDHPANSECTFSLAKMSSDATIKTPPKGGWKMDILKSLRDLVNHVEKETKTESVSDRLSKAIGDPEKASAMANIMKGVDPSQKEELLKALTEALELEKAAPEGSAEFDPRNGREVDEANYGVNRDGVRSMPGPAKGGTELEVRDGVPLAGGTSSGTVTDASHAKGTDTLGTTGKEDADISGTTEGTTVSPIDATIDASAEGKEAAAEKTKEELAAAKAEGKEEDLSTVQDPSSKDASKALGEEDDLAKKAAMKEGMDSENTLLDIDTGNDDISSMSPAEKARHESNMKNMLPHEKVGYMAAVMAKAPSVAESISSRVAPADGNEDRVTMKSAEIADLIKRLEVVEMKSDNAEELARTLSDGSGLSKAIGDANDLAKSASDVIAKYDDISKTQDRLDERMSYLENTRGIKRSSNLDLNKSADEKDSWRDSFI